MLQLGSTAPEPREMTLDDIFFFRLKLLLRMATDYIEGCAFSDLRCQVIADNARYIQSESIELGCIGQTEKEEPAPRSGVFIDHDFFRSVYELAVLMERAAKNEPLNDRHKQALQENFLAVRHIQHTTYYEELFPGHLN